MSDTGRLLTEQQIARFFGRVVETYTPTTGQTVTVAETTDDVVVFINPAGALAALTITFPSTARAGQKVYVLISQAIASVTMNNVTHNALSSSLAGDCLVFVRPTTTTLYRTAS